jgi:hypothetical protein
VTLFPNPPKDILIFLACLRVFAFVVVFVVETTDGFLGLKMTCDFAALGPNITFTGLELEPPARGAEAEFVTFARFEGCEGVAGGAFTVGGTRVLASWFMVPGEVPPS